MFKRRQRSRFEETLRCSVAITTKTGRTVAGILFAEHLDGVTLVSARIEDEQGRLVAVDGEVFVRYDNIDVSQVGVRLPSATEGEARVERADVTHKFPPLRVTTVNE